MAPDPALGVKGAFRDWFFRYYLANGGNCSGKEKQAMELTECVFGKAESGPEGGGQAGAISVTDARMLAFPVRSDVAPFVWVTCPAVLSRLDRDLALVAPNLRCTVCSLSGRDEYVTIRGEITKERVVLEDLAVKRASSPGEAAELKSLFETLAPQVERLLLISDQHFTFLVETATEVQPQIRIDMETGTADDGSLRYQELLPADTVLYSLVFFTGERVANGGLLASVIRDCVRQAISTHVQMGGDMTLGRGLMEVQWEPAT